jgi:hypothetical protein
VRDNLEGGPGAMTLVVTVLSATFSSTLLVRGVG